MKIYTKTGDKATTSLIGGTRVSKNHVRLDAYGTIDELNSFIGLLITETKRKQDIDFLIYIQQKLFVIGSYLATDLSKIVTESECFIWGDDIALIEQQIDIINDLLPELSNFILPGGCRASALAHVCRSICRRAERCIASLNEAVSLPNQNPAIFINRLSDYFFVFARKENVENDINEIYWQNICK